MTAKDYLASPVVEEGDKLDYGVKGMRWGVRNLSDVKLVRSLEKDPNPRDIDSPVNASDRPTNSGETSGGSSYQGYLMAEGHAYTKYSDGRKKIWPKGRDKPITIAPPDSRAEHVVSNVGDVAWVASVASRALGHSDIAPDYLASSQVEEGDKLDYGVKGMKWGQRRSKAQLAAASKGAETLLKPPEGGETSVERYGRLKKVAEAGLATKLPDEDLKFFNARTEALTKINKLNQQKPGWLAATSKKVIQTTAEQQIQSISSAVANKYVSQPLIEAITKKAPEVAKKAAEKTAKS